MWLIGVLALPVFLYTAERVAALVRKSRIESQRAKAEYPITGNDLWAVRSFSEGVIAHHAWAKIRDQDCGGSPVSRDS